MWFRTCVTKSDLNDDSLDRAQTITVQLVYSGLSLVKIILCGGIS